MSNVFSSLPIISQNFYDIGFRIVEFGVVLWFPCVLWNCKRYLTYDFQNNINQFFSKGNISLLLHVPFYNFLYFSPENLWVLNPTTLFKSLKTSEKNETDAVKDSNQENYGSLYQVHGNDSSTSYLLDTSYNPEV